MVSTRFNIFYYAIIIFMSLHFVAYSLQDIEKTVMSTNKFDEGEAMLSRQQKETLNVVHVSSKVPVKSGIIGGRKMANMANKEHTNGEETSNKTWSSSSKNFNGDHKLHKGSKKIDHEVKVKRSSTFMVFNADYHIPRSHPPKNN